MNTRYSGGQAYLGLLVLIVLIASGLFGFTIARETEDILPLVFGLFCAVLLAVWVISEPIVGLALIISALMIADLLPSIPFFSSILPVLGIVTIIVFILRKKRETANGLLVPLSPLVVLGISYIAWLYFCDSTSLALEGGRNWLSTLIQLVALLIFGELIFEQQKKHTIFMWIFFSLAVTSSFFVIYDAFAMLVSDSTFRASGISEGVNGVSRYFLVGILFANYLLNSPASNSKVLRQAVIMLGMGLLAIGVLATLSRTGLLLLVVTLIIILIINKFSTRNSEQESKFQLGQWGIVVGIIITLAILPNSLYAALFERFAENINTNNLNVGNLNEDSELRLIIWDAGLQMIANNPITGIGIGQFPYQLENYSSFNIGKVVGAHNLYISVAAEAGIVGFLIYGAMLLYAIRVYLTTLKHMGYDRLLALTWFSVLILLLIGGLTKHDEYDKLLWLSLALSRALQKFYQNNSNLEASSAQTLGK